MGAKESLSLQEILKRINKEQGDNVLTIKYKDWHGYPSLQARIDAVVKFSKRFAWYEKRVNSGKIKVVPVMGE